VKHRSTPVPGDRIPVRFTRSGEADIGTDTVLERLDLLDDRTITAGEGQARMAIKRMSSSVLLCCLTFLTLILIAPAAAAATIDANSPAVTPTSSHPGPVALATTGLDIAMPVVIGLGTLILGIILVAWAFLRTGSTEHR